MKNDLIRRRSAECAEYLHLGQDCGQQQVLDAVMIWLHRRGWGMKRIGQLYDGVNDTLNEFAPAYRPGMEQDVWQERMDRELRAACGDDARFRPFAVRYPMVKQPRYDRAPKR